MLAIRHVLFVFAIALSVALTAAWDGLVAYGLFRLVSGAFQLGDRPGAVSLARRNVWQSLIDATDAQEGTT